MPQKPKLLIAQRLLPPYRLAFFQRLAKSKKLDLVMAYGEGHKGSAMDSIRSPEGIRVLPVANVYVGPGWRFAYQRDLLSGIQLEHPDVVVTEFNPRVISGLRLMLRAKRKGYKFAWWGHGMEHRSGSFARKLRLWMAHRADAMILYNGPQADLFAELGVPREKLFVAWNSINTDEIAALTEPYNRAKRHRILHIGRFNPNKKIDLLVRGFAKALPKLPENVVLTLIGDGPLKESVATLVTELGIENRVEMTGPIYAKDDSGKVVGAPESMLVPYFNTAIVTASPGAIGLNAIHSLAYGVPILIADSEPHAPEVAAVEANVNSTYFASDNPDDLAAKLVEVTAWSDRLIHMSAAGIQRIEQQFSLGSMVRAFEECVQYVCSKRN